MMDFSMNTAPLTVTQSVTLELIDPTGAVTPIDAELHYDPRDPYAVTTVFITGHEPPCAGRSAATCSARGSTSRPATATSTSGPASTPTAAPS